MPLFPHDLSRASAELLDACRSRDLRIAAAESCTGGLLTGLLTEHSGSGDVVDRGFVTYSNAAKSQMLGVPPKLLARHGAVSEPVARAMAEGALRASGADLSIAITGIAGPTGGSADKPVGLVHFATARDGAATYAHVERYGDPGRGEIRLAALRTALGLLAARLAD